MRYLLILGLITLLFLVVLFALVSIPLFANTNIYKSIDVNPRIQYSNTSLTQDAKPVDIDMLIP
jgi:hypothetical protein